MSDYTESDWDWDDHDVALALPVTADEHEKGRCDACEKPGIYSLCCGDHQARMCPACVIRCHDEHPTPPVSADQQTERVAVARGWNVLGGTHDRTVIDDLGRHVCEARDAETAALIVRLAAVGSGQTEEAVAREVAELRTAHELMVKQFRIMQREKEHGWREAERWEDRAEAATEAVARVRAVADDDEAAEGVARAEAAQHEGELRDYWLMFATIREQSAARIRAALDGDATTGKEPM